MKFNTVKSKVVLFLSILTLIGTIFCIVSCDNFLSQNLGKTTININLDLSKLIKNSRNDDTQITGYVLKLFVYDAKNYQEGDKEIENLPLLTQTSNKVDMTTGTVKSSLEVAIASTVIFVGKLFTLNGNNVESDKPLYAGKSDVYKVLPYNNSVHLVLSRDKAEIGFEIELAETHTHTFAEEWSTSLSHHWKETTCGHNDVMAEFTEHSFSDWTTTQQPTEEDSGSKERTCSVCNYKEVVEIANLSHTHTFAEEWTTIATHHWKEATCGHNDVMAEFTEHSFSDWITTQQPTEEDSGSKERTCSVCNYKEVVEIANLSHTHTFAEEWTTIATHHWKEATCGHNDVMAEFKEHSFSDWTTTEPTEEEAGSKERTCDVCNYKETAEIEKIPTGFVYVKGTKITGTETWTPESEVFVRGRQLTIPDLYVSDHEVTRGEYIAVMGSDPSTADAYDKNGNKLTGEDVLNNPVNYVSWYDALVYCNNLSIKENLTPCYTIDGSTNPYVWGTVPTSSNSTWNAATCNFEADGYRLPTEAEWEWLARGGEEYTYAGSDTVGDVAWYTNNTNDTGTREVKTKLANGYGLYDMSGNVYEWCWDWYGSINESTATDGATSGDGRVPRGGTWYYGDSLCKVADRSHIGPGYRSYFYGLRVVRPSSK